ncbi:MAG: hypothetical protein ABIN89_31665 [Chitinophagaceae bacterium]
MRFPLAYYLMLLYVTVMLKPLIPVISDAYSHTFGEAIHLVSVHAKYGSNHLEQSLAKTGAENSKDQKNLNPGENFPFHIKTPECRFDFFQHRIHNNYTLIRFRKPSAIFLAKLVPPPKC